MTSQFTAVSAVIPSLHEDLLSEHKEESSVQNKPVTLLQPFKPQAQEICPFTNSLYTVPFVYSHFGEQIGSNTPDGPIPSGHQ